MFAMKFRNQSYERSFVLKKSYNFKLDWSTYAIKEFKKNTCMYSFYRIASAYVRMWNNYDF